MSITATVLAIAVLAAVSCLIPFVMRLRSPWLPVWALVRASAQLALVSLLLSGIIGDPVWVVCFLVVMVVAAVLVVRQRLRLSLRATLVAAGVLVASSGICVAVVVAAGAIQADGRHLLALGGIVVGGSMTAATLAGRALQLHRYEQRDEIQGWLALGATPRRANRRAVQAAIAHAMIPATDQTRTTGIVTLPGAFVGAVFAGAEPLEAAQFQLVVLAAVLATTALVAWGICAAFGAPATIADAADAQDRRS